MNNLKRIFYGAFGLLFIYLVINILFRDVSTLYNIKSIWFLPISIIILVIWYLIWLGIDKIFSKIDKRKKIVITIITFFIIFLIECLVINYFQIPYGWDFEYIFNQAKDYALGHKLPIESSVPYYFQHFPNNIMFYGILIFIFKVCILFNFSFGGAGVFINAFIILGAIIFTYLYLIKKYNDKVAYFSLIIFMFFVPLFLYIPIVYSDTFSIIFLPLLLYLSLFLDSEPKKKKIAIYILFGLFTFIGCKIKMTVLFAALGIIIANFLNKEFKKSIYSFGSVMIVFITVGSLFNYLTINRDILHIKYDDYGKMPYTHWIMMGINNPDFKPPYKISYGGYSGEDYLFSESFKTGEEAKKANIKEIKRRIGKYGFIGYTNYLTNKAVNCWGDGSYYIPVKMHWASKYNMDDNLRFITGNNNEHQMIYFMSSVQFAFLILLSFNFVKNLIKNEDNNLEVILSISMLLLFLLLWENRSRYLYNYIPLFVITIVNNIDRIKIRLKKI